MFREDEEAAYFRTKEEFIQKLDLYLTDDKRRSSVARSGYQRVISDGHDIVSRMKSMLSMVIVTELQRGCV